jgi:hypothetical protein
MDTGSREESALDQNPSVPLRTPSELKSINDIHIASDRWNRRTACNQPGNLLRHMYTLQRAMMGRGPAS